MALASVLLTLAALQDPQAPHGYYMCELKREGPSGTIFVAQTLMTHGEPSPRLTWWVPPRWPRGVFFAIGWRGDRPAEVMEAGDVETFFFLFGERPRMRIVIRRIGPDGARENRFIGALTAAWGAPSAHIAWPAFRDMARGAAALELVATSEDGRIESAVEIAARDIGQVETMVAEAQPAFDAIVAERQSRCPFQDNRHITVTG
jgi:hypothetical protein